MMLRRPLRSILRATRSGPLRTVRISRSSRRFASSRGFSHVLDFVTIQPPNGQLTPKDFKLKAALVVNTASRCGHAAQLKGLQQLHEKYGEKGLLVVAVPSNDFAGQEPGSSDEIRELYKTKFGVTFPIAEKTAVSGEKAHPFFKKIADRYSASVAPTWNFDKFLVDYRGDMRAVFPNDTDPLVAEVITEIEEVLEELPRALAAGPDVEDGEYDFDDSDSDSDSDSDDEEEYDDEEDDDSDSDSDDEEEEDTRARVK